MNAPRTIAILLVCFSMLLAVWAYFVLPSTIVTHWGIEGEPNGLMEKLLGLSVFPILTLFIFGLFEILPSLDPLNPGFKNFRAAYDWFVAGIIAFIICIEALTISWNLGYAFSFNLLITPLFALLLFGVGVLLGKVRRNWFVGIRTPWTIASERNWNKTHEVGAILYMIAGYFSLLGFLFPLQAIWIVLLAAIVPAIVTLVYSYVEFRKENATGRSKPKSAKRKRK